MNVTPVKISGIKLVLRIIKRINEEYAFSDSTPEDYKKGWNDFSKALSNALENMQVEENKEPPKSVYQQMRERQAERYAWQNEV